MATCSIMTDDATVSYEQMGARYLSYAYKPSTPEPITLWAGKSLTPLYFETVQKYDRLELYFMFKNKSLESVSTLIRALRKCTVEIDDGFADGKVFECILTGNDFEKVARNLQTVKFTFDAITYGKWVTETVTPSTTGIMVGGSKQTEAVVTFENRTDSVMRGVSITMGGDTYAPHLIDQGETFVIDGIKKTATAGIVNAWARIDFINFPRLDAGFNPIAVTGDALASIAYRERW